MRLRIPMTGTVIDYDPEAAKFDNCGVSGDPNDCVRPINLDLGGIAWRLISIDLENDLMEVEATAPDIIELPVLDKGNPVLNEDKNPVYYSRPTTPIEKQAILNNAQTILTSRTIDEHYIVTGDKKLQKTANVIVKYAFFRDMRTQAKDGS